MELITPDVGLMFWMCVAFLIVLFALIIFAFPIIKKMLKEREEKINNALIIADRTEAEMKNLKANNEKMLHEAREQSDDIIAEARKIRDKIIEEAKTKATADANIIVENAKERIENERMAALTEIKNQIADISIEIAEKVLKRELESESKQKEYIENLLKDVK